MMLVLILAEHCLQHTSEEHGMGMDSLGRLERVPQLDGNDDLVSNKNENTDSINCPAILCANVRSLIPKIDCVCETLREEGIGIGFLAF